MGGETRVTRTLADATSAPGFAAALTAFAPRRFNVPARVQGRETAPAPVFSVHMDMLPASSGVWRHDPFGGVDESVALADVVPASRIVRRIATRWRT